MLLILNCSWRGHYKINLSRFCSSHGSGIHVLLLTLKLLVNTVVSGMSRASSVVELRVLYAGAQISDLFYGANIYLDKVPQFPGRI